MIWPEMPGPSRNGWVAAGVVPFLEVLPFLAGLCFSLDLARGMGVPVVFYKVPDARARRFVPEVCKTGGERWALFQRRQPSEAFRPYCR